MMFPHLLKMYQFLYNFSVYCFCYPMKYDVILSKTNESFYLSQYFDLRHTIYKNIFCKYNIDTKLSNFNYYRHTPYEDGTLLHRCAAADYRSYGLILLRDGFDVDTKNRHTGKGCFTPLKICQGKSGSLLEPYVLVEWS